MYYETMIDGIHLTFPRGRNKGNYVITNTLTGACFILNRKAQAEGEYTITYTDCFGNIIVNNKNLKITYNKDEVIQFDRYRSHVCFSNDMSITALPMKDIQELANQTFYLDNQMHVVDFLRFAFRTSNSMELFLLEMY